MMEQLFNRLEGFIINKNQKVNLDKIIEREKILNCIFPDSMKEFYHYYGENKEILTSYYIFDTLDEICIKNEGLVFGRNHQGINEIGIRKDKLVNADPQISKYVRELEGWYAESVFASSFFFNIACWQVLNQLPAIGVIHTTKEEFLSIVDKRMQFIGEDKRIIGAYDVISCIDKENNILACYLKEAEELYLGAREDEILISFEEKNQLDLDWL